MKRTDLPRSVFPKGKRYYLVTAEGKRRIWTKLSAISEGLPALYTALAAARSQASPTGKVPALIAQWEREVMPAHAEKTQRDERARGKVIADALVEFDPAEVETPDCSEFLQQFKSKPRTFNAYRGQLREYMRFAEEKGRRPAGSNPLQAIKTLATPPRTRYITDSERRRIKVHAIGRRESQMKAGLIIENQGGRMLCALIDMAYLTGQAISDLLALEWSAFKADGIVFARSKVEKTTGSKVTIEWTPQLRDVERRLRELRVARRAFTPCVFTGRDGRPLSYWGASSAWQRARKRAGVRGCTFHDFKAKALTDKEERDGMQAASAMGQHSTEQQTAAYVRRRAGRKTGATR